MAVDGDYLGDESGPHDGCADQAFRLSPRLTSLIVDGLVVSDQTVGAHKRADSNSQAKLRTANIGHRR
ncbi:hypothetical protein ACFQL7_05790 [Halocatena marina]|uniref:Transposase n=1 Tax=Halocatena marina TaxID=2934937 RepID=A0ABD5YJG8_9EURY